MYFRCVSQTILDATEARVAQYKKAGRKKADSAKDIADKKAVVLISLEKCLGVVTTACRDAGIGRRTFYNWLSNDEEFALAVHEIEQVTIDFVESQFYKLIQEKNVAAVIYFLKTRGKERGYTERLELGMSGMHVQAQIFLPENNRSKDTPKIAPVSKPFIEASPKPRAKPKAKKAKPKAAKKAAKKAAPKKQSKRKAAKKK